MRIPLVVDGRRDGRVVSLSCANRLEQEERWRGERWISSPNGAIPLHSIESSEFLQRDPTDRKVKKKVAMLRSI